MKDLNRGRSAMITTELAISLVLVSIVLFVTLGLFSDNLKEMMARGNFNNMFKGNYGSTFFSAFQRDYSGSQVEVQTMGEQGLEVIRKNANNSAEELIDKTFSAPGGQASEVTANTIAYLAQVIQIIAGSPAVCTTMDEPSKAPCDEITNVAGKYDVMVSSNAVTITRKYKSDSEIPSSKQMAFKHSRYFGTMASINPRFSAGGISPNSYPSTGDFKTRFKAIQGLSAAYKGKIDSSYALTRDIQAIVVSSDLVRTSQTIVATSFPDRLIALLDKMAADAKTANAIYEARPLKEGLEACWDNGCEVVTTSDLEKIIAWIATMKAMVAKYTESTDSTAYIPSPTMVAKNNDINYSASDLGNFNTAGGALVAGSEDALLMAYMQCDISYDSDGLQQQENCYNPSTRKPVVTPDEDSIGDILEPYNIPYEVYKADENLLNAGTDAAEIATIVGGYKSVAQQLAISDGLKKVVRLLGGDTQNQINAAADFLMNFRAASGAYGFTSVVSQIDTVAASAPKAVATDIPPAADADEVACQQCEREQRKIRKQEGEVETLCIACY